MNTLVYIGMIPEAVKSIGKHEHPKWEIVYYTKGTGTIFIGDNPVDFMKGDLVFLPPNRPHYEISKEGYTNIHFIVEDLHAVGLETKIRDTENQDIYVLLTMIYKLYHLKNETNTLAIHYLMLALEQFIFKQLKTKDNNDCLYKCTERILLNISNPYFTIEKMLTDMRYNPDYMRRIFKKQNGISMKSYLLSKRIDYAKKLIETNRRSDLTVKQIAWMAGFTDPYYFSRVFKDMTDQSPSQYRETKHG